MIGSLRDPMRTEDRNVWLKLHGGLFVDLLTETQQFRLARLAVLSRLHEKALDVVAEFQRQV